jgi:hypothetical protein
MMSLGNIKAYEDKEDPIEAKRRKAKEILKEANFPGDPIDILKLLENKEELDKVCRKLKMKVFW